MASADEHFHAALLVWRAEPYDGDAVEERLLRIARPDPLAAVDLARRHLSADGVDVRGVAYQLLAVAAQVGDERVRVNVADLVIDVYAREHDADVLVGIVRALGGAQDKRGLPVLAALAAHPDVDVRRQVAGDLPMVLGDPPDVSGIAVLIALSADPEPHVRDWATFGLGTQTDAESEAIRRALWARTTDSYHDARDEAVVALARRLDSNVRPLVAELLSQPSVGALIFEATAHLKDPSLLHLLRKFDTTDDDVRAAIEACDHGHDRSP